MNYRGYDIELQKGTAFIADEYVIYKDENIVGVAETKAEAKRLVNELIAQDVDHESELS